MQSVAGPRSEPGAHVEPGRQAVEHDAARGQRDADTHRVGQPAEQRQERFHQHADDDDVGHRAHPGSLAQRDPARQHHHPDEQGDGAEPDEARVPDDPLREDIHGMLPRPASTSIAIEAA